MLRLENIQKFPSGNGNDIGQALFWTFYKPNQKHLKIINKKAPFKTFRDLGITSEIWKCATHTTKI